MPKRKTKVLPATPPTPLSRTLFRHGFTKENFSTPVLNANFNTRQTINATAEPASVPSAKLTMEATGRSSTLNGQINLVSHFRSSIPQCKPKKKRFKFIKFAEDLRPLILSRQVTYYYICLSLQMYICIYMNICLYINICKHIHNLTHIHYIKTVLVTAHIVRR